MDIRANLTVAQADAEKIAADLRAAEVAAAKTEVSWLKENWQYALAVAIGAMGLGLAIGMKFGAHLGK